MIWTIYFIGVSCSYCYFMYKAAVRGGAKEAIFDPNAGPWILWWFLMSLVWPISLPGMIVTTKGLKLHKELKEQRQLLIEEGLEEE